MRTRSWIAGLAALAVVTAAPAPRAAAADPPPSAKTPVAGAPGCPDLAAKLTLDTSLLNGRGQVVLHGKVCNEGNHEFVAPPQPAMRAEFQVATWHPPKTPAQEGNVSVIAAPVPVATHVTVGQCVPYEHRYSFDGIVRWLDPATRPVLAAGERLAHKEFTFHLLYPASGYTVKPGDDCNTNNNSASVTVTYADKK